MAVIRMLNEIHESGDDGSRFVESADKVNRGSWVWAQSLSQLRPAGQDFEICMRRRLGGFGCIQPHFRHRSQIGRGRPADPYFIERKLYPALTSIVESFCKPSAFRPIPLRYYLLWAEHPVGSLIGADRIEWKENSPPSTNLSGRDLAPLRWDFRTRIIFYEADRFGPWAIASSSSKPVSERMPRISSQRRGAYHHAGNADCGKLQPIIRPTSSLKASLSMAGSVTTISRKEIVGGGA